MRSLAAVGRSTYHSPRMESILTLAAAVALGLGTLVAANQLMRAADHPGRPRRVLASLWLPLCMVIPTVGLVAPIGVSGSGSLVDSLDALLIVPLGVLVAVPPILLFRSRWSHPDWHADDHVPLAWPAIGTMLLLLAVAGSGPQFLLIVACAAGLVFVWAETVPRMYEGHGGPGAGWVLVCLGAATGQGQSGRDKLLRKVGMARGASRCATSTTETFRHHLLEALSSLASGAAWRCANRQGSWGRAG